MSTPNSIRKNLENEEISKNAVKKAITLINEIEIELVPVIISIYDQNRIVLPKYWKYAKVTIEDYILL
jgi:hypothetical protein